MQGAAFALPQPAVAVHIRVSKAIWLLGSSQKRANAAHSEATGLQNGAVHVYEHKPETGLSIDMKQPMESPPVRGPW